MEIKILVVEDDENEIENYIRKLADFSEDHDINFIATYTKSAEDAILKLKSYNFDAVFVDLILEGDTTTEPGSGESVLQYLLSLKADKVITFVVSSTVQAMSNDIAEKFENPLMNKYDRDAGQLDDALTKLHKISKTGLTKVIGLEGGLKKYIDIIYQEHLAKSFESWLESENVTENELLRFFSQRLVEFFDGNTVESGQSDNEVKYLPGEFYITPPIRKLIGTGDLISLNNKNYIVLSPSCDLVPRQTEKKGEYIFNVERVICAEIIRLDKNIVVDREISLNSKGESNTKAWKKFSDNMKTPGIKNRFHYLPSFMHLEESFVDFKALQSFKMEEIQSPSELKTNRIASVSSPFVKDIQGRFASYYARQGQPVGQW